MSCDNHTFDYIVIDKDLAKIQERCDECRLVLVCHTDNHIFNNSTRKNLGIRTVKTCARAFVKMFVIEKKGEIEVSLSSMLGDLQCTI